MKKQRRLIFIACLMAVLLIGGVFLARKLPSSTPSALPHLPCNPNEKQKVPWITYRDAKYHFRIDYRSDLPVRTLQNFSGSLSYAVDFGGSYYDAPDGSLAVIVEPTEISTAEEWIEAQNKRLQESPLSRDFPKDHPISQFTIEKRTILAGYPAIVINNTSWSMHEKIAVFIKDSNLFQIHGNGSSFLLCEDEETINREYERIWDSFRFEE